MESVGQLTGGIAHDFKQLLTVITGTIEILAEAVRASRISRANRDIDQRSGRPGIGVTANLLAFARKQPLQPVEIDVNALVNEVADYCRRHWAGRSRSRQRWAADVWPALVDPGHSVPRSVNLAINARDAMPDGGTLTFATSKHQVKRS